MSKGSSLTLDTGNTIDIFTKESRLTCFVNIANIGSEATVLRGKILLSCYKKEPFPIFPVKE